MDHADLEPGDLWVFSEKIKPHEGVQRVALILDTDVKTASVTAALASAELAFASDRDIVLTAEETGAYELMIETAMVAKLPWSHAHHRVGIVDDELVDAIIDFIWEDRPPELEERRGHAWLEPHIEERAQFEEAELKDLRKLAKRTDPRFGGGEDLATCAPTAVLTETVVGTGSVGTLALELIGRGLEHCFYREMTARDGRVPSIIDFANSVELTADEHQQVFGSLLGIGTVSDLRMLMQPEIDTLLSCGRITAADCIDGIKRFVIEPNYVQRETDWFVIFSPPLVQEFGRAGLVARTDDERDVYVFEAFD